MKFLFLILACLIASCVSAPKRYEAEQRLKRLKESEGFYVSHSEIEHPPKTDKENIPIIEGKPTSKYQVIGSMHYTSTYSMKDIQEDLRYNARKHGADAVILEPVASKSFQKPFSIPPIVTYQPYNSHSNLSINTYGSGGYALGNGVINTNSLVPIAQPGFNGIQTVTENEIHAYMIRFDHSERVIR